MVRSGLRIGIVGGGSSARTHCDRLVALEGVTIAGCADPDLASALRPAEGAGAPSLDDHPEMIRRAATDSVVNLALHPSHDRPAMEALQAGCDVSPEKPPSTSVPERCPGPARGRPALGGRAAVEPCSPQWPGDSGLDLDLVTAATTRLADGPPDTLAIFRVGAGTLFGWDFFGEKGRLRVTESSMAQEVGVGAGTVLPGCGPVRSVDGDFIEALANGPEPCCPASGLLGTVRLLEAISRSATIGQVVRLA